VSATDCLVQDSHNVGILAGASPVNPEPSTVTLERVEVLDTHRGTVAYTANGLVSQAGSTVVATQITIRETEGPALYAFTNASLSCTSCTLTDSAFAGAVVQAGGELVIEDTLIEGTVAEPNSGAGLGVFVNSNYLASEGASTLTLRNSTVRDNDMGAVYIKGAGTYRLAGNTLAGGDGLAVDPDLWSHGDAVLVTTGEDIPGAWNEEEQVGLLLEGNAFSDSAGAGVFLDGASATLSGNTYDGNTVDLVRQACGNTEAPEGLEDEPLTTSELCPDYDYPTQDLELTTYLEEVQASY
jgi:hypothetical protein